MLVIDDPNDRQQIDERERCPKCGKRGFYMAISWYWIFRCDHCGHKESNLPKQSPAPSQGA